MDLGSQPCLYSEGTALYKSDHSVTDRCPDNKLKHDTSANYKLRV